MKCNKLYLCLIALALVVICWNFSPPKWRASNPLDDNGNPEIEFSVLETYRKQNEINGKLVSVSGYLSSIGETLYLVDASGEKKLQIPERIFDLKKGSASNLLVIYGKYESSGEVLIDNFLTEIKLIRIKQIRNEGRIDAPKE